MFLNVTTRMIIARKGTIKMRIFQESSGRQKWQQPAGNLDWGKEIYNSSKDMLEHENMMVSGGQDSLDVLVLGYLLKFYLASDP